MVGRIVRERSRGVWRNVLGMFSRGGGKEKIR